MPEAPIVDGAGRGFNLDHQKVSVDVNLADCSIEGWTELTVVPTSQSLKQIALDCRGCRIHGICVNNKKASYIFDDLVSNSKLPKSLSTTVTAHQSEQYKRKIATVFEDNLAGELFIQLPKGTKILPADPNDPASGEFQPLIVKVEFSITDPADGINFFGGKNSNIRKKYWHAYTRHSPLGRSASNWLPCVDGLWDLCSWEIEISVPRTIGDIVKQMENQNSTLPIDNASSETGFNDRELDQEIMVVCSTTTPKEVAHPFDSTKKVVSFNLYSPVSAQNVGFAVGPFVQVPIMDLRENDDELHDDEDSSGIPISAYCLSDRVTDTANTCVFLYRAMEFYTKEFGSYPFTSYSICFVSDMPRLSASAVGLTLCSDELLFPPEAIDPVFSSTTEELSLALAAQWVGVNILPATWNDIWVTIGIGRFMALQFIRRLIGNNEYRFKVKKRAEEICRQDLNKPPLADPGLRFPIAEKDLEFIQLKAPIVLFILDRRMTKTDRSFGLVRVISKLFLQSMSQDLNSTISTQHFIKLCERVSHSQLEPFFDQWVYGPGYPVFRVTQRFNKKRMFIEMGIRQVQNSEVNSPFITEESFVDDASRYISGKDGDHTPEPLFTGSMTIRIHEADGTPYEHVVELKESFTKLDIQYNTKYKRLKRSTRRGGGAGQASVIGVANGGTSENSVEPATPADPEGPDNSADNNVLLHCLGDVLQTDEEVSEWKLSDWGNEEEERMVNEAFEWMRVDADFEWICVLYINQPDYMFASQLQQDRDVVAQYDAVQYFGSQKPSGLYSSMLLRTLVDRRYYYGIREEAALALARNSVDENNHIGKFHLMKAFQALFCFENSLIPRSNNFSDFPAYFVQKAIPRALSTIRDSQGNCPIDVKNFLLDLLRYNENGDNPYSDSYYVCDLIRAIVNSLRVDEALGGSQAVISDVVLRIMLHKAVAEIDRCQRMDQWMPSIQNVVAILVLRQKELLARGGYITASFKDNLRLTRPGNDAKVRLTAFQSIADLGGLKSKEIAHYMMFTACNDQELVIRSGLVEVLTRAAGVLALYGDRSASYYKKKHAIRNHPQALIIDEGGSQESGNGSRQMDARREALARSTVSGAIDFLRKDVSQSEYAALKSEIWIALTANNDRLDLISRRLLLDVCQVLYEPEEKYVITLPVPRVDKLVAKHLGQGKMVIKKERLQLKLSKKEKKKQKEVKEVKDTKDTDDQPVVSTSTGLKLKIKSLKPGASTSSPAVTKTKTPSTPGAEAKTATTTATPAAGKTTITATPTTASGKPKKARKNAVRVLSSEAGKTFVVAISTFKKKSKSEKRKKSLAKDSSGADAPTPKRLIVSLSVKPPSERKAASQQHTPLNPTTTDDSTFDHSTDAVYHEPTEVVQNGHAEPNIKSLDLHGQSHTNSFTNDDHAEDESMQDVFSEPEAEPEPEPLKLKKPLKIKLKF